MAEISVTVTDAATVEITVRVYEPERVAFLLPRTSGESSGSAEVEAA